MYTGKAYQVLDIKSVEDEGGEVVVRGVASTPTPDRIGDIVEPLGAKFAVPMPLLWQHDSKKPIGHVVYAKPHKSGIPFEARIPKVRELGALKDRVDEAIQSLKYKLVGATSIGFKAIEDKVEMLKGGGLRFLEWEWYELSLVTIPMNPEAMITSVKSIDAEIRRALATKSLGTNRLPNSPGAAGQRPERTTMKTIEQQLEELQQDRGAHVTRMKELNDGCNGDFTSLSADEAKEYDEIAAEMRTVDTNVNRLKAMQIAISGAVEVPTSAGTSLERGSRVRAGLSAEPKEKEDPTRKGIAFAQYVRLMYHAKGMPIIALQLAENRKFRNGLDRRVPTMIKAAVEAGSVGGLATAGNWGMELVGDETGAVADFIEFLRPQTILGKFGQGNVPSLRRVPFRVPLIGMSTGMTGYWVGEGKAKPLTKATFTRTSLEPLKVAAITVVTKELLADSSPSADAMLRDELANALIARTDIDFVDPAKAAVANVSPASITNGLVAITATGTGDAADIRTDVRAAFGAFTAADSSPTSGVWIMRATTALALSLMQNALGQAEFPGISMNGGTFAGLPVIVSEHVPGVTAGDYVILVNAKDIYYGDDGGVTVDTSEHASLEMDDAPSHDSVTPTETTLVSMYQTNSVAFRAERRIDWMRRRDSGVQLIETVNWGEA
jgi:HK97 family phage major capsid protein/HK97 family phage prohead protease